MKIKIRQRPIEQIIEAREIKGVAGNSKCDRAIGAAVDLRRRECFQKVDGLAQASFQFGQRLLVVLEFGNVYTGEPCAGAFGYIGSDTYLTREREHVGKQPRLDKRRIIDLARSRMPNGFVEYGFEI